MFDDLQRVISLPSLDAEYRFGHPKTYLAPHELARLTLVRSMLGETRAERAAEHIVSWRQASATGGSLVGLGDGSVRPSPHPNARNERA